MCPLYLSIKEFVLFYTLRPSLESVVLSTVKVSNCKIHQIDYFLEEINYMIEKRIRKYSYCKLEIDI